MCIRDSLTPWRGCYRSAALLGGESTFVLANTGHIQTLVCPPGKAKSRYWVGPDPGPDPDAWESLLHTINDSLATRPPRDALNPARSNRWEPASTTTAES